MARSKRKIRDLPGLIDFEIETRARDASHFYDDAGLAWLQFQLTQDIDPRLQNPQGVDPQAQPNQRSSSQRLKRPRKPHTPKAPPRPPPPPEQ